MPTSAELASDPKNSVGFSYNSSFSHEDLTNKPIYKAFSNLPMITSKESLGTETHDVSVITKRKASSAIVKTMDGNSEEESTTLKQGTTTKDHIKRIVTCPARCVTIMNVLLLLFILQALFGLLSSKFYMTRCLIAIRFHIVVYHWRQHRLQYQSLSKVSNEAHRGL